MTVICILVLAFLNFLNMSIVNMLMKDEILKYEVNLETLLRLLSSTVLRNLRVTLFKKLMKLFIGKPNSSRPYLLNRFFWRRINICKLSSKSVLANLLPKESLLFIIDQKLVHFLISVRIKLNHLFLMHPFSTPWKHQKTVMS